MDFERLIEPILRISKESECVEFKHNNHDPEETGEYISALSNSAALCKRAEAWLVWGVEDATKSVVGTTFQPREQKVNNEELENWLSRQLTPKINFVIHEGTHDGKRLVVFQIQASKNGPTRFRETAFIRNGTYKKRLQDFPEKERLLWLSANLPPFEEQTAASNLTLGQVLEVLNYQDFFSLLKQGVPTSDEGILRVLLQHDLVTRNSDDLFDVTNLGAILFARRLNDFVSLRRKAVRVIQYEGVDRLKTIKETEGTLGYASGFQKLIEFVESQLPKNEHIGQAFRTEAALYPKLVIRELTANTLIHQDFSSKGNGPLIEIFSNRLEFTNPGIPLINPLRFIDEPPQSRNETLAAFMRRVGICEERGSGIDKVITAVEMYQLPPPDFRVTENHTKAIVYAPDSFASMDRKDKIRACYQHASLLFVSGDLMTNSSLRKRFSIPEQNYAIASRIISDTIEAKLVKVYDPDNTSKKHTKYVPFWA